MVHLPYTANSQNVLSNPGPGSKVIKYKSVLLSMRKQPNKNPKNLIPVLLSTKLLIQNPKYLGDNQRTNL